MSIKPCDICEDKHECQFEQRGPCDELILWEEAPMTGDDYMDAEMMQKRGYYELFKE